MTKPENIIVTLMEECAEVQQSASKILRFGKDNFHPDHPEETNEHQLLTEYYQLIATMEYLISSGILSDFWEDEIDRIKINKTEKLLLWQHFSDSLGLIE